MLGDTISWEGGAYVKGRQMLETVSVVNEVIGLKRKMKKEGLVLYLAYWGGCCSLKLQTA